MNHFRRVNVLETPKYLVEEELVVLFSELLLPEYG